MFQLKYFYVFIIAIATMPLLWSMQKQLQDQDKTIDDYLKQCLPYKHYQEIKKLEQEEVKELEQQKKNSDDVKNFLEKTVSLKEIIKHQPKQKKRNRVRNDPLLRCPGCNVERFPQVMPGHIMQSHIVTQNEELDFYECIFPSCQEKYSKYEDIRLHIVKHLKKM